MKFFRETIALSLVKNMGPMSFKKLCDFFGDPSQVLKASLSDFAAVQGLKGISHAELVSPTLLDKADKEIEKAAKKGIRILTLFDEEYPDDLKNIYDPPIALYLKGVRLDKQAPKVAIIGARLASPYGERMAREIAKDLVRAGVIVVSGMALGIDSAAHEGALAGKGETYAVLGGGIGKLYPSQNIKLSEKISQSGTLISEYPTDMEPLPGFFPVRNRIISGLSRAIVVVEAGKKSGSLITVETALDQGRDVFAIPGNADSKRSMGSNALLKDGAKLALSAEDILRELNLVSVKNNSAEEEKPRKNLNPIESRILDVLEAETLYVDDVIEKSGLSAGEAMSTLSILEIKGYVRQLPGKQFTIR